MYKRVLMIFILGVSIAILRGSVVEAHLAGTLYKPVYQHVSSYDCIGTFGGVPNLEIHPALFLCEAVVKEFEILCKNPTGKVNFGNSGPRIVKQMAGSLITPADLSEKDKGKSQTRVRLPDTVLDAAQALCEARNKNWDAEDELVTLVDVRLKSFDCLDEDCILTQQASESLLRCTRPIGPNGPYTLDPRVNNPPPPGVNTDYECTVLAEAHCDTGDVCPIP